ncbi:nucleotide-diphosphate-sugar epimerase [Kitasatospora phosalacinea]|uniref:Nucleotide-diphosphate-sugar epimerase n=1 Tax=Kitasatospora phosalacinea TaxID=2065 RepID=A0A9W6Q4D2_9ACTN|nr:NAD(P)H-binding protein [Kitasatospora phosalacinea]GLW69715.1 nucleotide-diphosphate-sugar epimerase [Kitasatospora phosalacinea]
MTVLVTGARGQVGRAVLQQLHAAGRPVRAASARPAELALPPGVPRVELVLNRPDTFAAALAGVRQVFLYPEPAGVDAFVAAAEAAGVEHVVLLSSASVLAPDAESDPLGAHNLAVERALTASGLSATLLRADAFASNALGWARSIGAGLPVELPYPEAHVAPIHPADIADVAVAALTASTPAAPAPAAGAPARPGLRGRAVTLTGGQSLTLRAQVGVLAEVLGREVPVRTISRAEAERQLSRFMPAPLVGSLLSFWSAATAGPATVGDTTRSLLGTPERTFRQWAVENAAAFAAN